MHVHVQQKVLSAHSILYLQVLQYKPLISLYVRRWSVNGCRWTHSKLRCVFMFSQWVNDSADHAHFIHVVKRQKLHVLTNGKSYIRVTCTCICVLDYNSPISHRSTLEYN